MLLGRRNPRHISLRIENNHHACEAIQMPALHKKQEWLVYNGYTVSSRKQMNSSDSIFEF